MASYPAFSNAGFHSTIQHWEKMVGENTYHGAERQLTQVLNCVGTLFAQFPIGAGLDLDWTWTGLGLEKSLLSIGSW
jgi:hypothetical protein